MHRPDIVELARTGIDKIIPIVVEPPAPWASENIRFDLCENAAMGRLDFSFSPFLRDPVAAWDFRGVKREVTVVAPEQTGKTLCWLAGLLWSFKFAPCLSLVVYKSDDFAEKINIQKVIPLMKMVPEFLEELNIPRASRKDCYHFSNLKSYFIGSGSRISSMSSKINIADELDDWEMREGYCSSLDDLRKRARSFSESILYKVCSVRSGGDLNRSLIWDEFEQSSRGYFTLRCCKCKELSIRSCDTFSLQFECDENRAVKRETCMVKCPRCGYMHDERKRFWLIDGGAYVHEKPELLNERPGFQWGALACKFEDFSWHKIAAAQLDAGSSGSLEKQILFDNSYRGLPFRARRRADANEKLLKQRAVKCPDSISYCLMGVDTQDDCFFYVVRGWDDRGNSYLVECGKAINAEVLSTKWNTKFNGRIPELGIIDMGGHRAKDVGAFISDKPEFWSYKGRGQLAYRRWERARDNSRLLLGNPDIFKAELLYLMYASDHQGANEWHAAPEMAEDYLSQMLDHRPDNKKRDGNKYANWTSSGNDHYFDCEKMLLLLNEVRGKIAQRQESSRSEIRKPKIQPQ